MILVIGDSCIDKFIYGKCNRLCPEAPVPVFLPSEFTTNPGMAANVKENLNSLGLEVDLVTNENKIHKVRYVDKSSNQLIIRVDENDECDRIDRSILYEKLNQQWDAVVVSDYNKGFLNEKDIQYISENVKCPVFLDTKKLLGRYCENIDFIKINETEYNKNLELHGNLEFLDKKMIVTLGGKGCQYDNVIYKTEPINTFDVSGAGDTFLSSFIYSYLNSKNISDSIIFANKKAREVVQIKGVATVKK